MSYVASRKYVSIDPENPQAVAICDASGFFFNRRDLQRQMEWRGNALVWTGFLVGSPFLDVPNEQLRTYPLPPDPIPVIQPRPPQGQETWVTGSFNPYAMQQLENAKFIN